MHCNHSSATQGQWGLHQAEHKVRFSVLFKCKGLALCFFLTESWVLLSTLSRARLRKIIDTILWAISIPDKDQLCFCSACFSLAWDRKHFLSLSQLFSYLLTCSLFRTSSASQRNASNSKVTTQFRSSKTEQERGRGSTWGKDKKTKKIPERKLNGPEGKWGFLFSFLYFYLVL